MLARPWLAALITLGCGTPRGGRDAATAPAPSSPVGSCAAPLPLEPGEIRDGQFPASGPIEQVWAIEAARPARVTVSALPRFEHGFLHLVGDVCWLPRCGAPVEDCVELGSVDGAVLQKALPAGRSLLRARRTEGETGAYSLTASLADVEERRAACSGAPALPPGTIVTFESGPEDAPDRFQAPCGEGGATHGGDAVRVLELPAQSRVRLRQTGQEGTALALWGDCGHDTPLACATKSLDDERLALLVRLLPAGRYHVVSDALSPGSGFHQLLAEVAPAEGGGTRDDACAGAPVVEPGTILVDTLSARDDVTVECGGPGAPDVFRTLVVPVPSWLTIEPAGSEVDETDGEAVVAVRRSCAPDAPDLHCMPIAWEAGLHEKLAAGRYVLVFDGSDADAFGASRLSIDLDPVADAERACRDAPVLRPGVRVAGRTSGHDRVLGCQEYVEGDDAIFRVVLDHAASVRARVTAVGDVALSFRRTCELRAEAISCAVDESRPSSRFHDAATEAQLDAGTTWLVVEGMSPTPTPFELELEVR